MVAAVLSVMTAVPEEFLEAPRIPFISFALKVEHLELDAGRPLNLALFSAASARSHSRKRWSPITHWIRAVSYEVLVAVKRKHCACIACSGLTQNVYISIKRLKST
jgi:hypothetical protein